MRVLIGMVLAVLGGCGGRVPSADFSTGADESPTRATLRGDWDDVEAALVVAAGKAEMAVVMISASDANEFRAELTTPSDAAVDLVIERAPGGPADEFDAACRSRPFGDAKAERRLIGFLSRRLEQLHGRAWAPVR